jgi:hypothetical protein
LEALLAFRLSLFTSLEQITHVEAPTSTAQMISAAIQALRQRKKAFNLPWSKMM